MGDILVGRSGMFGFEPRKVITMCHFDRPAYTREVLDWLRACDGIADYLLLPHVEPGNDAVRSLIESIDFAESIPTFNSERCGVDLNTDLALEDGFQRSRFVIHVEDDILLAPDALRFFEWCRDRFARSQSVFSVAAYNRNVALPPRLSWHRVLRRNWFHPWAFATWRNRWERFRGHLRKAPGGWDDYLNRTFFTGKQSEGLFEVYPMFSRAQNIGMKSSLGHGPPEWLAQLMYVPHWVGDYDVPFDRFQFVGCD